MVADRLEHRFLAKIGAFPPDSARWAAVVRTVDAPGLIAQHHRVSCRLSSLLDVEARRDDPITLPAPDGDVAVLLNGFELRTTSPGGFESGWHLAALGMRLGAPRRIGDRIEIPCVRRVRPARSPDLITDPSVLGRWPAERPTSYELHLDLLVLSAPDLNAVRRTFASGAEHVVAFEDEEELDSPASTRRNRTVEGEGGYGFAFPALLGFEFDLTDAIGDRDGRFVRAMGFRIKRFDYDGEGRGHVVPRVAFSNDGLVPLPWDGLFRIHTAMIQLPSGSSTVQELQGESAPTAGWQEHRQPL